MIIVISLLLYYSMYSYACRSIKEYVITAEREAQLRASGLICGYFNDAESTLDQLSSDSELRAFAAAKQPLTGSDYLTLRSIHNTLYSYKKTNSTFKTILFYYPNSDVICSDSIASARLKSAYNSCVAYEGITKDEWLEKILSSGPVAIWESTRVGSAEKTNVLTYLRVFPTNSLNRHPAYAMIQIDAELVQKALETDSLAQSTQSYILDQNNHILFSRHSESGSYDLSNIDFNDGYAELEINGKSIVAFSAPVGFRNLKCVTLFDLDSMMVKTTHHRNILLIILAFSLIIELVYAICMTRFNYRPIKSILKLLPNSHEGKYTNEYGAIRESISTLNTENSRMHRMIATQEDLLQSLRISRLLGYEPGLDSLDVDQVGLSDTAVAFFVFVLGLSGGLREDSQFLFRDLSAQFKNTMEQKCENTRMLTLDYAMNRSAVIVPLDKEEDYETIIMKLFEILKEINSRTDNGLVMGIGTISSDTDSIGKSFSEARLAIQQADADGKDAELYTDIADLHEVYEYSAEVETRLQQMIISGNSKDALDLTNHLYWKLRDSASPYRLRVLLNALYGTLMRIRQMNLLKSPSAERQLYFLLNEIEFNTNMVQRFSAIQKTILFYCESLTEERQSGSSTLWSKVNEYISEHYSDPDLCLDSIADEFNVSAKYLSRCFKEQTQNNLSTTITSIRMNHAKMILETQDINIEQLSLMCGYRSSNTFYKAFRRTWGVSPSDYREIMAKKQRETI